MPELNETKITRKADVVFLVDVTGSMTQCIEDLKGNIENLAVSLEGNSDVVVDWRAKAIGYRDLEADPVGEQFVGKDYAFVSTSSELGAQAKPFVAKGGGAGIEEIPESALDAIKMIAEKEDWIDIGSGHRIIVLLTDAPTKVKTVDGDDVLAISQMLSDNHFRILVYGPKTREFEILGKIPKSAFTDVSNGVPEDVYLGLKNLDWEKLNETLCNSVSDEVPPVAPVLKASTSSTSGSSPLSVPDDSAILGSGAKTVGT